jgi:cyclase
MLKKRLVGVVTVKDGWAVQSFGYKRYLPLGRPECLIENLDRWGADEILVQVIDRSVDCQIPDFELLERIARLGLETPLIYGGGIRSVHDGVRAIQFGADRLVVDSIAHDDPCIVRGLSEQLGAQAIIAALPLSLHSGRIEWLDYRRRCATPIPEDILSLLETGVASETLIIDWTNEGYPEAFQVDLVKMFPLSAVPLIAFGGISASRQMIELLSFSNVAAIAVGNFLSYREHAVQEFKKALAGMSLRPPVYESTLPGLTDA